MPSQCSNPNQSLWRRHISIWWRRLWRSRADPTDMLATTKCGIVASRSAVGTDAGRWGCSAGSAWALPSNCLSVWFVARDVMGPEYWQLAEGRAIGRQTPSGPLRRAGARNGTDRRPMPSSLEALLRACFGGHRPSLQARLCDLQSASHASLPELPRITQGFGSARTRTRLWSINLLESGPNLSETHISEIDSGPTLAEITPTPVEFGPTSPDMGQTCPGIHQMLFQARPTWATYAIGRHRPSFVRNRPKLAKFFPTRSNSVGFGRVMAGVFAV